MAATLTFIVGAVTLTGRLWSNADHELRDAPQDQAFLEWMLAHGARIASRADDPFFSDLQNVPDGINIMANTSVLAVSLPMAPITLTFGPHVAFTLFLTCALALTASCWYFVLSRTVVTSRSAAFVGALFCGFAPAMVSHAGGHPNIVAQFLVPLIILRTVRLHDGGRTTRNGLQLAALVVSQAFINLEILFMTAVGLAVFTAVMAAARPDVRRRAPAFVTALTVCAAASTAVLSYPLYQLFAGPQSYRGLPSYIRAMGADLRSFVAYAGRSVAGDEATALRLAQNTAEQNAFFGWGLLILLVGLVWWMRRHADIIALTTVAVLFAVLSLGPRISVDGTPTGIPSLWSLVETLPVLHSVVPTRWALAITPVIGVVLALGWQRVTDEAVRHGAPRTSVRATATVVTAMCLVPLTPTPLPTRPMAATPELISKGTWRRYVDKDHSVVTLPLPDSSYPDPLRWSAMTGLDMRLARGYFLAPGADPDNPDDRTAAFSAPPRPTDTFFAALRAGRATPPLTAELSRAVHRDLAYWQAGLVVLAPQPRAADLRHAMTRLLGVEATWIDGVWLWQVKHLHGTTGPSHDHSRP